MIFLGKFLQTPGVNYIAIGQSKQTTTNLAQNMAITGALLCYWKRKGEVRHAHEEEAPFLCQLDHFLSSLDVILRRVDFDFNATRLG